MLFALLNRPSPSSFYLGSQICVLTSDSVVDNKSPLPPPGANDEEEFKLLQNEPYIDGPIKVDYGTNLRHVSLKLHLIMRSPSSCS